MADLTKTVSTQLGLVGLGYPVYWGTMVWGTDVWGSYRPGFEVLHGVDNVLTMTTAQDLSVVWDRVIANSMVVSSTMDLSATFDRVIENDVDLTSSMGKDPVKGIANDLTTSSENDSVYIQVGEYYRVFPGYVTNALNKVTPSFTTQSTSTTWATASTPTTTWS